jgi:hypothetical protein
LVDRGYLSREEADKIYLDKATRLPGSDDARSRKIQDYIELFNVDEARATKLVDGKLKMEINDATGRMILTDQITQQSWEIPISDTNVFVPAPKPGRTLWDMKEWATGPASALKAWWNVPAAIMDMPVDQRVTNARQGFATANQELIRSLAINPRFPVAEQERIKEEISVGSQFFDHPTLMRERMISLRNSLTTRMQQAERDANDPNLNEDLRSAQQSNVTTIQNYLAVLGVPAEGSEDVPFIVNGESDYADVPPGAWYQWNNQLRRKSE